MSGILPRLSAALADRYVFERELGRGGMATVYLARDLKHDRLVAMKVLHPELAASLGNRPRVHFALDAIDGQFHALSPAD